MAPPPLPGRVDDRPQIDVGRRPAEIAADGLGGRVEHRRIARPPRPHRVRDRRAGHGFDGLQHLAHRERAADAEVVGARGAALLEMAEGQQVGVGGVVDVHRIHLLVSLADAAELAGTPPRQDARHQVGIAWPPDEMRPQGDGGQLRAVGV